MSEARKFFVVAMAVMALAAPSVAAPVPTHKCDPVDPIEDVGWSVVPSLETVGESDSAPYQDGSGDWFVDRTTTLLPFCNYYDEIGLYSLRSYTLSRQIVKERVTICGGAGGSVAVPPYAGLCPPK